MSARYGDSITTGYGVAGGWPAFLPGAWVRFNGGIDGERGIPARKADGTESVSGALRPVRAPDFGVLAAGWDVVVMMWGTNDTAFPGYSDELSQPPPGWEGPVLRDEDLMDSLEGAAMTLQAAGVRPDVAWPPPLLPHALVAELVNARLQRMRDPMRARLEGVRRPTPPPQIP